MGRRQHLTHRYGEGARIPRCLRTQARTGYHPSVLLKLYIYGYLNRVQSSRRLEREAGRNVEVMWLTGRLAALFLAGCMSRRPSPATWAGTSHIRPVPPASTSAAGRRTSDASGQMRRSELSTIDAVRIGAYRAADSDPQEFELKCFRTACAGVPGSRVNVS